MTFRQWCESLAQESIDPTTGAKRPGLLVDGKPFRLDNRPAMAWIYDQVPSTQEEAFRATLILRKCAQVGFTVLEILAAIYLALKFDPLKLGMFVPSSDLAQGKSSERFMPILRTVPEAYARLTQEVDGSRQRSKGEGNVMIRRMGGSLFHFLWTSGRTTTESYPMDAIMFDEVQDMLIADMEKARERLSASEFKYTLMGSTANWPDADIDYWYKKGSQHRFHTHCPTCGVMEPLDDYFPACIRFDPTYPDRVTGAPGDYRYVCRTGHWIDDPQAGEWVADNPDAVARKVVSIHFHQMLSPTISPREMYEDYTGADDMKNFYNRKLGKPYQDPTQIPVTLAHLNACAEEGMRRGLVWKKGGRGTFMGIDQMGAFNVVLIKERLADGRQALAHAEFIYSSDPFARCDELMEQYGVVICVVEQLPNFNDALRFSNRHPGRVFLCDGYGELADDMIRWGDAPNEDVSERRTDEEDQTRYTVRIDQYKMMQVSLHADREDPMPVPGPARPDPGGPREGGAQVGRAAQGRDLHPLPEDRPGHGADQRRRTQAAAPGAEGRHRPARELRQHALRRGLGARPRHGDVHAAAAERRGRVGSGESHIGDPSAGPARACRGDDGGYPAAWPALRPVPLLSARAGWPAA